LKENPKTLVLDDFVEIKQTTNIGKYICFKWQNTNLLIRITRTTIAISIPPQPTPMAMYSAWSLSVMEKRYMNRANYQLFYQIYEYSLEII
jgi:hypothetical protein